MLNCKNGGFQIGFVVVVTRRNAFSANQMSDIFVPQLEQSTKLFTCSRNSVDARSAGGGNVNDGVAKAMLLKCRLDL